MNCPNNSKPCKAVTLSVEAETLLKKYCYAERKVRVILSVRTKDGLTLWHTRKGLTTDARKAWSFKTVKHGATLAKRKYSPMLGVNLAEWEVNTVRFIGE